MERKEREGDCAEGRSRGDERASGQENIVAPLC